MPLYEYACPKCGSPVERLISRSSFTLKGGGWYSDGYKTASANSGASKR